LRRVRNEYSWCVVSSAHRARTSGRCPWDQTTAAVCQRFLFGVRSTGANLHTGAGPAVKSTRQLDIGGAPTPGSGDDSHAAAPGSGNIGGKLGLAALARLCFFTLTREQQATVIRQMVADGMSEYGASHATGYSIEMIREILGEREVGDCD